MGGSLVGMMPRDVEEEMEAETIDIECSTLKRYRIAPNGKNEHNGMRRVEAEELLKMISLQEAPPAPHLSAASPTGSAHLRPDGQTDHAHFCCSCCDEWEVVVPPIIHWEATPTHFHSQYIQESIEQVSAFLRIEIRYRK